MFLITLIQTVCGIYLGASADVDVSAKLFCCFLHPSIGLGLGVLAIENYLNHNSGSMDYTFTNHNKNYPSLSNIIIVMSFSFVIYFILATMLPLDWIYDRQATTEALFAARSDDVHYPCDVQTVDEDGQRQALLHVDSLTHVYPNGT